ncbi:MAG: hypothetical protein M3P47_04100 [Pseudomonadota bacterium]|nr:hypothetical protein [Pseudomonadota bacterium]
MNSSTRSIRFRPAALLQGFSTIVDRVERNNAQSITRFNSSSGAQLTQLRVPVVQVEKTAVHACLPCLYLSLA